MPRRSTPTCRSSSPVMSDTPEPFPDDREIWRAGSPARCRAEDGELSALEMTAAQTCLREHLRSQPICCGCRRAIWCWRRSWPSRSTTTATCAPRWRRRRGPDAAAGAIEKMQIALKRVQALDPLGVGARSVAECLLLQAPGIEDARSRMLAERIISQHLNLLASRDIPSLAQLLDVSVAEAETVCLKLRRFDTRPGWRYETHAGRLHRAGRADHQGPRPVARAAESGGDPEGADEPGLRRVVPAAPPAGPRGRWRPICRSALDDAQHRAALLDHPGRGRRTCAASATSWSSARRR